MNNLTITNSTISFNHQVIKTSNISSIDLKESKYEPHGCLLLIMVGSIVGGFGGMLVGGLAKGKMDDFFSGLFFLALGIVIYFVQKKERKDNHRFILLINTNSGSLELFSHKDYDFINSIRKQIQEVLDASSPPLSITYNVDNKTVIKNPTGNIAITNITQYQGLSDADKNFLLNSFEPALLRIKEEIIKANNDEIRRNFDMLTQELKSPKPRKSILEAAWSVVSNLTTVSDLAGTIERGISMFQ